MASQPKRARAFNFDIDREEMLSFIMDDALSDDSSCGGISSSEESDLNREILAESEESSNDHEEEQQETDSPPPDSDPSSVVVGFLCLYRLIHHYEKMAVSSILEIFEGPNGGVLAVATGLFLVLITTLLLVFLRKGGRRGNAVLLVGLTDSGKTLLFSRLTTGKYVMTHTSMKENKGSYTLKGKNQGKTLDVIDIPGHSRIRFQFLDKQEGQARAIIFVIDSVNFPRELKDVAEQMYDILCNKHLLKAAVPILVACNKQDMTTAKSSRVIKLQLEKEINTLRVTRSAALQGTDGSSKDSFIGKKGKDFEFAHVEPVKVEFVECTCKGDTEGKDPDINAVYDWINKVA